MTNPIVYVFVLDNQEAIQRLLSASMAVNEGGILERASVQEWCTALAAAEIALDALDFALPKAKEMMLIPRPPEGTQIPVILVNTGKQAKHQRRRSASGADGHFKRAAIADDAVQSASINQVANPPILRVGDLTIDRARRLVTVGKVEMHLTPTEYELISLLAAQAGSVVSHEQLLHEIWGNINKHTVQLLRVNISNLRRKMNAMGGNPPQSTLESALESTLAGSQTILPYISNEPGIGYRLRAAF